MIKSVIIRRDESSWTSFRLRVDARFGVVEFGSRNGAEGFEANDVVDGCINFEDEGRKKEMGTSFIAGEIAAFRHLAVPA
jgi:hypothetical protein